MSNYHRLHHIFHRMREQGRKGPFVLNPLVVATQSDEDFIGRPSRTSRRVCSRTIVQRTLQRGLLAAYAKYVENGIIIPESRHWYICHYSPIGAIMRYQTILKLKAVMSLVDDTRKTSKDSRYPWFNIQSQTMLGLGNPAALGWRCAPGWEEKGMQRGWFKSRCIHNPHQSIQNPKTGFWVWKPVFLQDPSNLKETVGLGIYIYIKM